MQYNENSKNPHEVVKEYYGKTITDKDNLQTGVCCSVDSMPEKHKMILEVIEPEILNRFYGCGSPIPPALEGRVVLDLGCGTGRDVYLASKLVGQHGFVIGVDMTEEQLEIARKYQNIQTQRFGYNKPNVDFREGYIEELRTLDIQDESIDIVISNCVINLASDKKAVFKEIFRVLKPGGELYFSDIFSDRRIPGHLQSDPLLYGECLAGALYIEDFRRMIRDIGCLDYRIFSKSAVKLDDPQIEAKIGMIDFYSITIRAFKLYNLEDICEDYGQIAVYKGNLPESPHHFKLDDHHLFVARKPMLVCGNTAAMLQDTRYSKYFDVIGDRSMHFGLFDCKGSSVPLESQENVAAGSCC